VLTERGRERDLRRADGRELFGALLALAVVFAVRFDHTLGAKLTDDAIAGAVVSWFRERTDSQRKVNWGERERERETAKSRVFERDVFMEKTRLALKIAQRVVLVSIGTANGTQNWRTGGRTLTRGDPIPIDVT
jgi:hypothetical protein